MANSLQNILTVETITTNSITDYEEVVYIKSQKIKILVTGFGPFYYVNKKTTGENKGKQTIDNPSEKIIDELKNIKKSNPTRFKEMDIELDFEKIKTSYNDVNNVFSKKKTNDYDAILSLGLDGNNIQFRLETEGRNTFNKIISDIDNNYYPDGYKKIEDNVNNTSKKPTSYKTMMVQLSKIDSGRTVGEYIVNILKQKFPKYNKGVFVTGDAQSAGDFVCNYTIYHTADLLVEQKNNNTFATFIHLPFIDDGYSKVGNEVEIIEKSNGQISHFKFCSVNDTKPTGTWYSMPLDDMVNAVIVVLDLMAKEIRERKKEEIKKK